MKLKLADKRQEAKGTKSFFWETERPIKYLPGQYFYFTLPKLNYPDPRGATRHFTLSSSPTEPPLIRITTRIREESGYKKTLDEMEIGTIIDGEGPNGTFVLDEAEKGPHVLLAGGIGITPFRSMIKYSIDRSLKASIILLYACSIPEEIIFRKELEGYADLTQSLKLQLTVSRPEKAKNGWTGLTGRIDAAMVKKLIPDYSSLNPTFWLCGPPPMVEAIEPVLGELNISSARIRSEKFTGY